MLPEYTTHRYFFDWIEPNSRVLDIGCNTGAVGRELKKEKNCYVVGIDVNDVHELDGYDYYIKSDIEIAEFNNFIPFDYIILGDVLEHLNHPLDVLLKVKKWIKPEGYILVSVPNIANWRIRLALLFGDFNYTDNGIMDITHKRFFTKKTITYLIESAGLEINEMKTTADMLPARFWCAVGRTYPIFAHQFVICSAYITRI